MQYAAQADPVASATCEEAIEMERSKSSARFTCHLSWALLLPSVLHLQTPTAADFLIGLDNQTWQDYSAFHHLPSGLLAPERKLLCRDEAIGQ